MDFSNYVFIDPTSKEEIFKEKRKDSENKGVKKKSKKKKRRKSKKEEDHDSDIENFLSELRSKREKENEWVDHLMENLYEDENDFWESSFNQHFHSKKVEPEDPLSQLSEEKYAEYISQGMHERKKRKHTSLPGYKEYENPKKRPHKEQPKNTSKSNELKQPYLPKHDNAKLVKLRSEYSAKWNSIMEIMKKDTSENSKSKTTFNILDIPWPFTDWTISNFFAKLRKKDPCLEIEETFTIEILLGFLGINLKRPITPIDYSFAKNTLKQELLKWHPDKFFRYNLLPNKELSKSSKSHTEFSAAISLINHISQLLKECWSNL